MTGKDERPTGSGIVVAGGGPLEIGKVYGVRHSRKGSFTGRVTQIDGEWITVEITDGIARAAMSYNVRDIGEEVTIRAGHSLFIPIAEAS